MEVYLYLLCWNWDFERLGFYFIYTWIIKSVIEVILSLSVYLNLI